MSDIGDAVIKDIGEAYVALKDDYAIVCDACETQSDLIQKLKDEVQYLTWFKQNADFGPADSDVHALMDENYTEETGNEVPVEWKESDDMHDIEMSALKTGFMDGDGG